MAFASTWRSCAAVRRAALDYGSFRTAIFSLCQRQQRKFSITQKSFHDQQLDFDVQQSLERARRLRDAYTRLEITDAENCSQKDLKDAYLRLARKYHPDTGGDNSDSGLFNAVQSAYKYIVTEQYEADEQQDMMNDIPTAFDIQHVVPQHRQYLEYGGLGSGTPSQRRSQYARHRVHQAHSEVGEYRFRKVYAQDTAGELTMMTAEETAYAKRWKTRNAIERLVEDLIVDGMKKGEFDKLPGQGKPLKHLQQRHLYVDSTTRKMNEILLNNGFAPDWIAQEKEIRQRVAELRTALLSDRRTLPAQRADWSQRQQGYWQTVQQRLQQDIAQLNKAIDRYNLICPIMHKQIFHYSVEREVNKCDTAVEDQSEADSA